MEKRLMPFMILTLVCLIMVIVLLLLFVKLGKRSNRGEVRDSLDSFFLRDDEMVINTLIQRPIYKIREIDYVRFYRPFRLRSSYIGGYRIFKTNGKKSRRFMFYGSVYTRRMQLWSSREDILKSIEKMRTELRTLGIRSEYSEA